MKIHAVRWIDEVLHLALAEAPKPLKAKAPEAEPAIESKKGKGNEHLHATQGINILSK